MQTLTSHCQSKINGDGALAHASFGAADGDDFSDVGDRSLFGQAWGFAISM